MQMSQRPGPQARQHGRHELAAGDARGRVRWRIAERVVSVSLGGAAVVTGLYLGLTGPLVSPVAAPVNAAGTVTLGTTTDGSDPGGAATTLLTPSVGGADGHRSTGHGGRDAEGRQDGR